MKMQKLMGALILILMLGATPVTAQNMKIGRASCRERV